MSKKIKVVTAADGAVTLTHTDAGISDLATTLLGTDEVLSGSYALIQRAGLVVGGMALQQFRNDGNWNPFSV